MTHILTLIANPDIHALNENLVEDIFKMLPSAGKHVWLSEGEACDIPFSPEGDQPDLDAVRRAIGSSPIDFVSQRTGVRRKGLLVADMDSTIIGQECIDELADFAGLKPKIAAITERAMRGELEFEPALRERVGLLEDLDESVLHKVFAERISLNPGARTLVRTMRANGAMTVIVSGGFSFFTGRVAEAAGFDAHQANTLEFRGGKLAGRVVEPILGKQSKLNALRRYREKLNLTHDQTLAVGDGANDLAMLMEAGLGVAYHAKPVVAASAHARIDYCDLNALLFAQGYARADFVEDEDTP